MRVIHDNSDRRWNLHHICSRRGSREYPSMGDSLGCHCRRRSSRTVCKSHPFPVVFKLLPKY